MENEKDLKKSDCSCQPDCCCDPECDCESEEDSNCDCGC
jgi:hypothetical protein